MSIKKTTKKTSKTSKVSKKLKSSAVKKTPKKASKKVKKKASKKTPKKKVRALVCAPGKKCFWTTDGTVLENLNDLQIAFGSMDDEVFLHHVSKDKNDFAQWVEEVLQDAACASDLRSSKKASTARAVVVRHLRFYNF